MTKSRALSKVMMIVVGVVGLVVVANYVFSSKVVPSYSDFVASSTASQTTSAPDQSTSTAELASAATSTVPTLTIKAPRGIIHAFVASTSDAQALGLGQRASLPADEGMLFVFQYPGDYGFWMKDMHFPLDMVWVLSNKRVAGIATNVSPDTYPTVFYPPLAISYVLELNAGAAEKYGIATDTQLEF